MKKVYKNTIEEAAEANVRLAELAGLVTRQKWLGLCLVPFVFVIGCLIIPYDMKVRLLVAGFISVVFFVGHLLTVKDQIRRNARRVLAKAQGTADPMPCEYELTDEHLIFRKLGQELRFSWPSVVSVSRTATGIEVLMQPTGIAIIPARIFDRPEELQEWIRFIQEHSTASKASAIPQPAHG